jgi:hypothetical protein
VFRRFLIGAVAFLCCCPTIPRFPFNHHMRFIYVSERSENGRKGTQNTTRVNFRKPANILSRKEPLSKRRYLVSY